MSDIGYSYLKNTLNLSVFKLARPAKVAPVLSVTLTPEALLVPEKVAPKDNHPLTHLLFALKHEGTNLQVLSQALKKIAAQDLLAAIQAAPTATYVRIACYLWEAFNKHDLVGAPLISGNSVNLFDPKRYMTGPSVRNAKWRVNFNGLGSLDYCATVEITPRITALLESKILQRANEFVSHLGVAASDRAIAWAYLSETKSSFEIERESASPSKAEAFVELLKKAHIISQLDEANLVALQNTVITNHLDLASCYRHQQNWLSSALRGAAGVTYIPPPPALVEDLMKGLVAFANSAPKQIDPIIAASIISFGFVFIHPFMDGNGRLSRFLFHHALCQSEQLKNGLLLPVSVAMKRHENEYLTTLKSFSEPVRSMWNVLWIENDQYEFTFNSDESIYRFWNATACVEFGLEMAKQALDKDLKEEIEFLSQYDRMYRSINNQYDVRGKDLNILILGCIDQKGIISANRRKKFVLTVPTKVFDAIEKAYENEFSASLFT
jgi:Fic family protein